MEKAWKHYRHVIEPELVDESIWGAFSEEEALRCIQVGILCTQQEPDDRPTICSVLKILLGLDSPQETQDKVATAFHKSKTECNESDAVSIDYPESSSPLAFETLYHNDEHNGMPEPFDDNAVSVEYEQHNATIP